MYKVKETFEYLVDNKDKFLSIEDVLYMVTDMTCPLWDGDYPDLPVNSLGNVEYIPWGSSDITITDLNAKVSIDKNALLQLIKDIIVVRHAGINFITNICDKLERE